MATQTLLDDNATPIRVLTLNRPQILNALDAHSLQELAQAFSSMGALDRRGNAPCVRCVILTGAGGKAFAAGADLAAMASMGADEAQRLAALGHRLSAIMESLPIPIIAAVDGFALGGGLELALACDFIIATRKSRFGQPEVGVGVTPGFGGTQRLPRRIGIGRARQLLYTGDFIDAEQALTWGLVNEVVDAPDLMSRARALGTTIAGRAPLAVAAVKRAINEGMNLPLQAALGIEEAAFSSSFSTADQKEGMKAFLQKRPAMFSGE